MPHITLQAQIRDTKTSVKKLREKGSIPAILYGHKVANVPLTLSYKEFEKVYRMARENTLVDLFMNKNESEPRLVLIHDIAKDVINETVLHVDLYQVRMDEPIV